VGFRWWASRRAQALDLKGFVRNLADGRVEVRAQGDTKTLDRWVKELRRGPRFARVIDVEQIEISDEVDEFISFDIR